MNIEEEVKSLKETVETLSAAVLLVTTTILDAVDEVAKEEEQEEKSGFEVQVMREFSDDEAKLIADVLWEYVNSDPTYNPVDERMVRLTHDGSINAREIMNKIYGLYPEPEYGDDDEVNFEYARWP